MLDLQKIFYWAGTIICLGIFLMLSVKFIKQIKNSSTKFGKYQTAIYWGFITAAFLAIAVNSLMVTCVG